jgi:hypothetical protein
MKWLDWYGCYKTSSKPWLVPEAFSHPAKMSIGLCQRIFEFMEDKGMIHRGDVIVDPFGGIGTTALVGATKGYQVICVELEERFIRMSNKYECPGISKEEWLRWFNRFGKNIVLCPSCQGKLQGAYEGNGVIPSKSAHLFVGNVEKHRELWERLNKPIPIVIQGDSRKLSEILATVDAAVMSPPYNLPMSQDHPGRSGGKRGIEPSEKGAFVRYGDTDGQIESLPQGSISAVISSPPYAESLKQESEEQTARKQRRIARSKSIYDGRKIETDSLGKAGLGGGYGESDGQIASLKDRGIEAVITSPPYAEIRQDGGSTRPGYTGMTPYSGESRNAWRTTRDQKNIGNVPEGNIASVITSPPYESAGTKADENPENYIRRDQERYELMKSRGIGRPKQSPGRYSGNRDNIGNQNAETYWSAMLTVFSECHKILKAGGYMAVVVKDFVRDKQRVPLCDNTVQLLEHLGFKVKYRVRAWLVEDQGVADMFHGKTTLKQRKSFFRRLCESKGSPRIDFEQVIICQKVSGLQVNQTEGKK